MQLVNILGNGYTYHTLYTLHYYTYTLFLYTLFWMDVDRQPADEDIDEGIDADTSEGRRAGKRLGYS